MLVKDESITLTSDFLFKFIFLISKMWTFFTVIK